MKFMLKSQFLLIVTIILLWCLPAMAEKPVVVLKEAPEPGQTVSGKQIDFTFFAQGGGTEVVPGSGPLILIAGGPASAEQNSTWQTINHMANRVYIGFKKYLGYTDDDIYYINGQASQDIDQDGIVDEDAIDLSTNSRACFEAAINGWACQHYKKGQTLYIWFIGHGGPDGTGARLKLDKDEYINELSLHNAITQFELATGCESVVVFIESCYAGLFAKQLSTERGRTIVMSAADDFVFYSNLGEVSFTCQMIDRFTIPYSLKKAYDDVRISMKSRTETKRQTPQIDTDGDGIPTTSELLVLDDFYVGGTQSRLYEMPVITNHTQAGNYSSAPELFLETDSTIESAWVSIVRPDFNPDKITAVFTQGAKYEEPVELIKLFQDPENQKKYTAKWENMNIDGSYAASFYVKDTGGYVASEGPVIIRKGTSAFISITTDKGVYDADETGILNVSLGGTGTGDVYIALIGPSGVLQALKLQDGAIALTSAIDIVNESIPVFVPQLGLFEFPETGLYNFNVSGFEAGDYQWYAVMAKPGTDLFAMDWLCYSSADFYVNGASAAVKTRNAFADTKAYAYKWFLQGVESDWPSSWSDFTTLAKNEFYTDVASGDYTFFVKAKTQDNEVSEEVSRFFHVSNEQQSASMTGFAIEPLEISISKGSTGKLNAISYYSDGTNADTSQSCRWTSQTSSVAAVSSDGTVTGIGVGQSVITASMSGFEAQATVTVTGSGSTIIDTTVGVVIINPSSLTLENTGQTFQLSAIAVHTDGTQQPLGSDVQGVIWTSTDPSIAVVDSTGLVTAVSNGQTQIICEYSGQKGTASVLVDTPFVTGLRIEPSEPSVLTSSGATLSLKAWCIYSKGPELDVTNTSNWQSSNQSVVVVASDGVAVAVAEGESQITAEFAGFSASITISAIFPHPALSVSHTLINLSAYKGQNADPVAFTAQNTGTGGMSVQTVEESNWFDVIASAAWLEAGQTADLTLNFMTSGLETGVYTGIITVLAPGALNSPQFVTINMEIQDAPAEPELGKTWTEPVTGMEFVWVEGGCYQMGCGTWTDDCYDNESPVHEVCLDGFYIGKYEVTQGQWQQIMGSNPSYFDSCGSNCPVENVSWNDTQDFIEQMRNQTGVELTLPSEAQWEYAARSGGKEEKYAGGNDVDAVAWYSGNSGSTTHPVGTKAANGLGIYDMSGNVWEWCEDWYSSDAYNYHDRDNPIYTAGGSNRVFRGGSWDYHARFVRAADRGGNTPSGRFYDLGFRLVRK